MGCGSSLSLLQVCDFGLAINAREETPSSRLGTLQYMSPEVVARGRGMGAGEGTGNVQWQGYTEMVDIWYAVATPWWPSSFPRFQVTIVHDRLA